MSLIAAAQRDDIESVKAIVAGGGVDVDDVDGHGFTALSLAAKKGFVDCVKILLEAKADVNKANRYGATPLYWASSYGLVECLKLLIAHGASINTPNSNGHSLLHFAATNGHLACVEQLIRAGAELERNKDGHTPLASAINHNHRACAERLLDAGAKISNVHEDVKIPDWVEAMVAKRRNVVASLRVFIGMMRKRYNVEGQHIGNRLPRDLVVLISKHLWSTRLDERWETEKSKQNAKGGPKTHSAPKPSLK